MYVAAVLLRSCAIKTPRVCNPSFSTIAKCVRGGCSGAHDTSAVHAHEPIYYKKQEEGERARAARQ